MIVTIGDFITADEPGFACSKGKLVKTGVKHLRPFNISSDGYLDMTEVFELPPSEVPRGKSSLAKGDILFNNTNSVEWVGKAALITSDMSVGWSNHITRIKLDRSKVLPEWFTYWLRQKQSAGYFAANATQWVSQAAYRVAELKLITIDLPPLEEQQRIVAILDRAASIQRLRRSADEKLKEIIPALFVDIFGDVERNVDNWPVERLEKIADIGSGVTKGRKLVNEDLVEVPYLRVANVQDGHLDLSEIKAIAIRTSEREKYALRHGDIVMTEGGDIDKLGRGYVWEEAIPYCAHQNHVFRVRVNRDFALPYYLATLIGSPIGKRYFLQVAKRTTGIASINKTQLGGMPVPLPPLARQQAFEDRLHGLMAIRGISDEASNSTVNLASSLRTCLFS